MASKLKIDQQVIEKIISSLEDIDFGTLQITVHDSQVTQIDKIEKYRFAVQKKVSQGQRANTI
ncbi:DUF2292 domain-containing protein [Bacillus sp. 03113]|uniref:YezD family protein n=1 Tax=Bacillus sp. 03113 TaxID=2578211 RepID=UPI001143BFC6|nr:DUF2292 domain-containing protein [Bacillus sp. 03113]